MDIFKLIFEHDLRLDQLKERHTNRSEQDVSMSIDEFMKPDPTYSKFYITGTVLPDQQFGINCLQKYPDFLEAFGSALVDYNTYLNHKLLDLPIVIKQAEIGEAILLTSAKDSGKSIDRLNIDSDSNVGHKKEMLAAVLQTDDLVLYKEQAHQGFDLHLFSKKNIYPDLFRALKPLISRDFRFFSINGKRIKSERKFYFETWTLKNPPHGAEEVLSETQI
ncbi:MAG: hypothetical protein WD735_01890 [Balneolaceae bacterium]